MIYADAPEVWEWLVEHHLKPQLEIVQQQVSRQGNIKQETADLQAEAELLQRCIGATMHKKVIEKQCIQPHPQSIDLTLPYKNSVPYDKKTYFIPGDSHDTLNTCGRNCTGFVRGQGQKIQLSGTILTDPSGVQHKRQWLGVQNTKA